MSPELYHLDDIRDNCSTCFNCCFSYCFISRPSAIRGNFELDLEGDEIDDEDDEENGNLGVPSSAIRPTGKMSIVPFHVHI